MNRDDRLAAKAISEQWPMSDEQRQACMNRMMRLVIDPQTTDRTAISAFKALVAANAQNQVNESTEPQHRIDRITLIAERFGIDLVSGAGQPDRQEDDSKSVSGMVIDAG